MILNDININKGILHILNNDGSNPILANKELILEDNVYKFIYKIVENYLKIKQLNLQNLMKDKA